MVMMEHDEASLGGQETGMWVEADVSRTGYKSSILIDDVAIG